MAGAIVVLRCFREKVLATLRVVAPGFQDAALPHPDVHVLLRTMLLLGRESLMM